MKPPYLVFKLWFYEKLLRLKITGFIRGIYFRYKIKHGIYVLKSLDGWMASAGYKRTERRQFWREFVNKQDARDKLIERLGR